jgi:GDPmannose 4,6-dehydratase
LLAVAHQSSQKETSEQAGLSNDDEEALYYKTNTHEPTEIMHALAEIAPSCRIFVAGSCHMFGETAKFPQSEKHAFHPCNLYARTKVALWENCQALRNRLCIAFGILYNHESPRRPFNFLSTRIARAAARAKLGGTEKLTVGSLSARVDWSYAPDVAGAMVSLVRHGCNGDYIIASGKLHSVEDMVRVAFEYVGLAWENFVQEDPGCYQPVAPTIFQGDISKILAQKIWRPRTAFHDIVHEMVDYHLKKEQESMP